MTKSNPTRILFVSLLAAFSFAPSALASWHDPVGSPEASNLHYTVASHDTATHQSKATEIARLQAELKRLDANYRFDRVPRDQR